MKIIKAKEYAFVGVFNFKDQGHFQVYRNKFNDLEWVKECKFVSDNGKDVFHCWLDNENNLRRTPTKASRIKNLGNSISELSQNIEIVN